MIPKIGEYWTIKSGENTFWYSIVVSENPVQVQYFELSAKGKSHKLDEEKNIFFVSQDDLGKKVEPTIEEKGKYRRFYHFQE